MQMWKNRIVASTCDLKVRVHIPTKYMLSRVPRGLKSPTFDLTPLTFFTQSQPLLSSYCTKLQSAALTFGLGCHQSAISNNNAPRHTVSLINPVIASLLSKYDKQRREAQPFHRAKCAT